MKDRRHFFGLGGHGDAERIRQALGLGDGTVYFIDDGRSHCMIGRFASVRRPMGASTAWSAE